MLGQDSWDVLAAVKKEMEENRVRVKISIRSMIILGSDGLLGMWVSGLANGYRINRYGSRLQDND